MQNLALERDDMELDAFVGNLNDGVRIVQQNIHKNYDVIISRGGTAALIEAMTQIPVVEISLSVYDILRAIKLAENYANRYAIVGFPGITDSAHTLSALLQYQIDIFTIHRQEEVPETLAELKRQGYRMVLCDMIAHTTAQQLGLNTILITSGNESISTAFDQAIRLSKSFLTLKEENQFLRTLISESTAKTVVLCEDGSVYYSSVPSIEPQSPLYAALQKELPTILSQDSHKFFKTFDDVLYSFICKRVFHQNKPYAACYFFSASIPASLNRHGILYYNPQDAADQFFQSFYTNTSSSDYLFHNQNALSQTDIPIMLLGEPGTGKEQAARMLYSESPLNNNPMILVNCGLIHDKSWNFITNHYNSPLNDNHNTIFFKDIHKLPEKQLQQLLSIIVDTNLCKRNRVLFSCVSSPNTGIPPEAMQFINLLSCITIHLPALRTFTDEIPALSSLYLNQLNVSLANQIIGFEPEAMELMQRYSWPNNYTQFKRILHELALMTQTPYIAAEHVKRILDKEDQFVSPTPQKTEHGYVLDLGKPLNELNQDIIRQVLQEFGGNQSAAAKRLGISRTTLWRYLK